jgi:hypothetical protein
MDFPADTYVSIFTDGPTFHPIGPNAADYAVDPDAILTQGGCLQLVAAIFDSDLPSLRCIHTHRWIRVPFLVL